MRPTARLLTFACLTLISIGTIWEFHYYNVDRELVRSPKKASKAQEDAPLSLTTEKSDLISRPASVKSRKLGTSLQGIVDATVQLPTLDAVPDTLKQQTHATVGDLEKLSASAKTLQHNLPTPAIILFCYDRVDYLNETLQSLAALPGLKYFSVYISQDGDHAGVAQLISEASRTLLKSSTTRSVEHWQHPREPLLSPHQPGHAWLTQHYKWGLSRVFEERRHSHAVVVEDDMLFSKDFLTYFAAMAPLLEQDPTIWCISTWNDNGLAHFDWRNDGLFRTSYFPGLGWMLRRQLWEELGPKFPLQAWDHWMRLDAVSKGRECVSPEVNRNKNIGERGANMQKSVFRRYLAQMAWSRQPVLDWGDLSRLHLPQYSAHLQGLLDGAQVMRQFLTARTLAESEPGKVRLLPYKGESYLKLARVFRVWPFPRGHHHHLTLLPYKGSTFILADERFCTLLPKELRVYPTASLQATPGATGQDCDSVCRQRGLACQQHDFWFINTCEELAKHFPCGKGCAVELGLDVPNYVTDPALPTFRTCLVTQSLPTCSAMHTGTRRLCPCV